MTTDGGTHVPLIVSWPGKVRPGRTTDALADFTDLLPTLCEAGGARVPEALQIDGKSFLPVLTGSGTGARSWTYCWYSRDGSTGKAKVFARNQRWKLYSDGRLIDVLHDPEETEPVAGDPGADVAETKAKLQGVIDRYAKMRSGQH